MALRLVWSNPNICAACGEPAEVDEEGPLLSIHRDGFDEGPQVPLCETCGGHELPTCEELWERIAARKP
jgi:hypothetical protein